MNYKVIKEYDRFYLAQAPAGYFECFLKCNCVLNEEGYIFKKIPEYEGHAIDPKKVNRDFNPRSSLKN